MCLVYDITLGSEKTVQYTYMTAREFFRLPNRVSRLYPVFALIFLLISSGLVYNWQTTQISSDTVVGRQNQQIDLLKAQVALLQTQQSSDQSTLKIQRQKIDASSAQLKALQDQLKSTTNELAQKDALLKTQTDQLKNQQDQLSKNAADIAQLRTHPPLFSFQNKSSLVDISTKEAAVKELVTNAYNYIQDLYGPPYLLNSIVITFVDSFSITGSSGEIVIENSDKGINVNIHLKDFDPNNFQDVNTVVHEMIHGYHGVAVLETSAMEEGETVAMADAVMERMIADKKIPAFVPLYLSISSTQYDTWNNTLKVAKESSTFYSDPNVSKVYQLIGTAWIRLYREDPTVFKKLNEAYYPKVQKGLVPDDAMIKDALRSIIPSVGGVPIDTYLANNRAFNAS
jgi:hypothetical protein